MENLSVPFDRRVWRECQALIQANYQVSVICPQGTDRDCGWREDVNGVSIFRYPAYASNGGVLSYLIEYSVALFFSFFLALYVAFRKGFDIIQICNPPDLLFLAAAPFKLFGKRVIFDQHDLSPEIFEAQRHGSASKRAVLKALLLTEQLTYRLADVVLVVNESCRQIALERGKKRTQDVFVVRNGPSLAEIAPARPNPTLKAGQPFLLVYVGMMGAQEGIDVLLRSIAALRNVHKRTDFHARIIGGGTVLEAMKAYAGQLGISELVTFTGPLSYAGVLEGIASADVCLCPDPKTSLSDKCSLVKIVEYMSMGRPFVAFELDEVRNSGGESGLYAKANDEADFASKTDELLNNAELREQMGELGRARVRDLLTWERSVETLYAAYRRAMSRGAEKPAAWSEACE